MKHSLLSTLVLFASVSSCADRGDVSPRYGIYMVGAVERINPTDVDRAWQIALGMAGADAGEVADRRAIAVTFTWEVIKCPTPEDPSRLCAGLTRWNEAQVWRPRPGACVLGAESSLIHEFFHIALSAAGNDADVNHVDPRWRTIDAMAAPCTDSN